MIHSNTSGSVEQDTAAITSSRRGIDIARQNISSSAQLDLTAIVRGSRIEITCGDFSVLTKQRNSGGRGNIFRGNIIRSNNLNCDGIFGDIV